MCVHVVAGLQICNKAAIDFNDHSQEYICMCVCMYAAGDGPSCWLVIIGYFDTLMRHKIFS